MCDGHVLHDCVPLNGNSCCKKHENVIASDLYSWQIEENLLFFQSVVVEFGINDLIIYYEKKSVFQLLKQILKKI